MKSIKAPEGGVYRQEFYKCNKERCKKCRDGPGHGPYWALFWWEDGKTRKKYIGKNLLLTKDTPEEEPVLTKDEPLPKTLTEDTPPPEPLPKTQKRLTEDKSLPKTSTPTGEEIKRALEAIRGFHARGIEPTAAEVAEAVGMESRPLGRLMAAAGIQAVNCHRGGVKARRYVFELRERIEERLVAGKIS
ncbi:hypothetical protein [Candidatus Methanocrinis natronophilus]|uniref:DUF6788 domain-containing protein n=1 Tax=Candidatus Methanocrinis natronophilus TaxID=3033396 RepID=A0ABT5XAC9_9EURY|nr:hypothetical protein [Candidatus Methanocrinis natronophilus]MDF0591669.1 hypothetical protein [Candidatus Methanocrinis natronophilus]